MHFFGFFRFLLRNNVLFQLRKFRHVTGLFPRNIYLPYRLINARNNFVRPFLAFNGLLIVLKCDLVVNVWSVHGVLPLFATDLANDGGFNRFLFGILVTIPRFFILFQGVVCFFLYVNNIRDWRPFSVIEFWFYRGDGFCGTGLS